MDLEPGILVLLRPVAVRVVDGRAAARVGAGGRIVRKLRAGSRTGGRVWRPGGGASGDRDVGSDGYVHLAVVRGLDMRL